VLHRNYEQLRVRLGLAATTPRQEEAEAEAPEPPAAPAPSEPALDDDTHHFVTQSLTDVDLFSSYGLSQKAVDLLETILQRAPRHTPSLERLLDIYLGAGDDRRTAELAARLHQIHRENGNSAAADRFGDLQRRFERAAGLEPGEAAPPPPIARAVPDAAAAAPEFAVPAQETEPVAESEHEAEPEPAAPEDAEEPANEPEISGEPNVHEVDLSEEWAALAEQLEDNPTSFREMASSLISQASGDPLDGATASEADAEAQPAYELELEAPAPEMMPPTDAMPATEALEAQDFLQSLASEFADAVPASQEEAPAAALQPVTAKSGVSQPAPAAEQPEAADEPLSPLGDVFDEFRADLDDLSSNGEDLETHYNLGTAYREMGLLDEAISEFQKVAKADKKGQSFRYMMQCCTLLGLAFMEKGQPGIAAMWYERALEISGLDQESILALRYDLGVAQELAGDVPAARRSFSQVYGMNIDYRDVAERLAALGKGN
jgi:tetratricopeptide (TPR) repeat protein